MAKYRVLAKSIEYCYVDIEADSAEEARWFADEVVDGSEFHYNAADVGFEIDDIVPLSDDDYVDFSVSEKER